MTNTRRSALALASALAWASLVAPAAAQATVWPTLGKPIRIVVPFAPGSGSDANARGVAKQLQDLLNGHPVIVDNKPGAGTFIGAQEVARAAADGQTQLHTIVITHTQNPHLSAKLPHDPFKDFTPLTQVLKSATVLVAQPAAPFNTVKERVAHAKAKPGKLNCASFSAGSPSRLNGELLAQRTGALPGQLIRGPQRSA